MGQFSQPCRPKSVLLAHCVLRSLVHHSPYLGLSRLPVRPVRAPIPPPRFTSLQASSPKSHRFLRKPKIRFVAHLVVRLVGVGGQGGLVGEGEMRHPTRPSLDLHSEPAPHLLPDTQQHRSQLSQRCITNVGHANMTITYWRCGALRPARRSARRHQLRPH